MVATELALWEILLCEGWNIGRLHSQSLVQYAFADLKKGWLACSVPNQCCISVNPQDILIWNGLWAWRIYFWKLNRVQYVFCARQEWEKCGLLADGPSLLQLVHLGIHRDLVNNCLPVTGSSLWRPLLLVFVNGQEADRSEWMWDRGTRQSLICGWQTPK
jgi:hypothetical protein